MQQANSMTLDGHLASVGPAAASFAEVWKMFWTQSSVPLAYFELARLTFARLHADAIEAELINPFIAADAVSAERRALVLAGKADASAAFTDIEKALMLYAEYFWLDVANIPAEARAPVRAALGESGHMIFCEALGLLDGRMRTARCLRDLSTHLNA